MPSHRETRLKSQTLLSIGGVNQRVYSAELEPQEYSDIQGVFPEFAGLQSRLWGKRLLKLYDSALYSINQFWTPQGYGVGLYQFSGTLDFGYWLTPSSVFDFTLPPLPTDLAGNTVDDFGYGPGENFDYGDQSACVLSFLNGSSDHSSCAPVSSAMGAPNDSNGGPAGQGKKCSYQSVKDDRELSTYTVSQQFGSISNTIQISDTDNCRDDPSLQPPCVPFPPLPEPIQPAPSLTYGAQTVNGVLSASKSLSTFAAFNPATHPFCFFKVTVNQTNHISANKLIIDLSPLLLETFDSCSLVVVQTPGGEVEFDLTPQLTPITLDANDYLNLPASTANANAGFDQAGSVTGHLIRLRTSSRVCV